MAGADISFYSNDPHKAVGCVVILEFPSMEIVYSSCREVELKHPYIPTYLAFREAPIVLSLLEEVKHQHSHIYPQVLFIDGNGTLHPRLFGLACHVGVLADIPSIGVAKNFCALSSEGLTMKGIKEKSSDLLKAPGDWFPIIGKSGTIFGGVIRGTKDARNPVFVSPGHRISLASAVALTVLCCKYRVPEPVRVADAVSREYIRQSLRKQGVSASTSMPAHTMS
ncbi:endonuclease V [Gaertneriomyces semiglobifer]|nr:endonuclease V [Gaertneriomyces semiglobifer]